MLKNAYCYETMGRNLLSDSSIRGKMLSDLNSNLNINGRMERRKTTLYNLVYTGNEQRLLKTKGVKPQILWNDHQTRKVLHNQKMSALIDFLNGANTDRKDPFLFSDKTNITYSIDIEFDINDVGNTDMLNLQLNRYGLSLVRKDEAIDVFVLSEKKQ